jgi:hypothetical protein
MQPPLIFVNLRETIDRLKTEASVVQTMAEQAGPSGNIAEEYVERIQIWLDRLPPVQRSRKFTITEVIALATLPGHYRPAASLRYTGEALRRCGFKQKRDWTAAGRNKRYWLLSGETK